MVKATLLQHSVVDDNADKKTTEKTTEKTTGKIIRLIKENPAITTAELAALCGISSDGIFWHVKNLKKQGTLIRVGGDKGGHWVVK